MGLMNSDKSGERQLQKLLTTEPRLFARLADQHLQSGEVKKAAKILVKGLQQFPASVSGWMVKGSLHLHLKQPKLARAAFEKALAIEPEIPVAHRYSAELAQQESDIEGNLSHLRALAALEPLDDNVQTMLQAAILRQTAVSKGLFSQVQVERMMPGTLRQALLRVNQLPQEIARRTERFAFPPDIETPVESPVPSVINQPEDRPVWKDPKVKEQIAKMEEEDRERIVRVAWADALNNPNETPLLEVEGDLLENSDEGDGDFSITPAAPKIPAKAEGKAVPPSGLKSDAPSLPSGMQKAMIKPYIPQQKPASPEPASTEELPKPQKTPPVEPPIPQKVVGATFESDWEGATPAPPPPPLQSSSGSPQPILKRPRLTADIKLPPMRPIDAAEETDSLLPPIPIQSPPEDLKVETEAKKPEIIVPPVEQIEQEIVEANEQPQEPVPPRPRPFRIESATAAFGSDSALLSQALKAKQPPPPLVPPLTARTRNVAEEQTISPEPVADPPESSVRFPRDDSSIQRLMGAKRDEPVSNVQKVSGLTRFELPGTGESESSSPGDAEEIDLSHQHVRHTSLKLDNLSESASEGTPSSTSQSVGGLPPLKARIYKPPVLESPIEFEAEEIPETFPEPKSKPASHTRPQSVLPKIDPSRPLPKVNERLEIIDEEPSSVRIPIPTVMPVQPPPPDLAAREEAVRQKLAAIVEEVTGKAPELETAKTPPPPTEEKSSDYQLKGKIATKTLAELYASQGDWKRSAEVYEVLLEKFPTNEAYRKRLDVLKAKMNE